MSRSAFSVPMRIALGGILFFGALLLVGWLLPGMWSAERSRVVDAPPSAIFPFVDSPAGWRRWTPWPDSILEVSGPTRGVGATMSWDHPDMGDGVFEIVEADEPTRVRYRVLVEDGALRTDGTVELEPVATGTRVTWMERGDFGWNPLMGYWALAMERVQGDELQKGLERLEEEVRSGSEVEVRPDVRPAGAPR